MHVASQIFALFLTKLPESVLQMYSSGQWHSTVFSLRKHSPQPGNPLHGESKSCKEQNSVFIQIATYLG